jgi:uncharacterized protein (UPF0335 family)
MTDENQIMDNANQTDNTADVESNNTEDNPIDNAFDSNTEDNPIDNAFENLSENKSNTETEKPKEYDYSQVNLNGFDKKNAENILSIAKEENINPETMNKISQLYWKQQLQQKEAELQQLETNKQAIKEQYGEVNFKQNNAKIAQALKQIAGNETDAIINELKDSGLITNPTIYQFLLSVANNTLESQGTINGSQVKEKKRPEDVIFGSINS